MRDLYTHMSTEDFNKRINEATKNITALRKDISYREDQANRGETTYSIDAEIRGQFTDLVFLYSLRNPLLLTFRKWSKTMRLIQKITISIANKYKSARGSIKSYQLTRVLSNVHTIVFSKRKLHKKSMLWQVNKRYI